MSRPRPAPSRPLASTRSRSSPSAPIRDLPGRQLRGTFLTSRNGDNINESQHQSDARHSLEVRRGSIVGIMRYDFLITSYETERIKVLTVWSEFRDEDLCFR